MSLANHAQVALEARGEYVVMANTSWFAMFPKTLEDRIRTSRAEGREGPNLVVYRTKSGLVRDHYAIPYSIIRDLLVEETITVSDINGSRRWNLTLRNGRLHVSHRPGTTDVSEYYGAALLVESTGIAEYDVDVHSLSAHEGQPRLVSHLRRERNRTIVRQKKESAETLSCEICGFSFEDLYGNAAEGYCEVHHLVPLSEIEASTVTRVEDLAILCANCHRVIHLRCPPYSLEEVRKFMRSDNL